jgi:hypothetical protein
VIGVTSFGEVFSGGVAGRIDISPICVGSLGADMQPYQKCMYTSDGEL